MKIKDGFVLEEVGGDFLAVAVGDRATEFSAMVRLNGTGAFLWNLLSESDKIGRASCRERVCLSV